MQRSVPSGFSYSQNPNAKEKENDLWKIIGRIDFTYVEVFHSHLQPVSKWLYYHSATITKPIEWLVKLGLWPTWSIRLIITSGARSVILPTNTVVPVWGRLFYKKTLFTYEIDKKQTFSLSPVFWAPLIGIPGGGVDI